MPPPRWPYAELNWNASSPGEYNLSARAYDKSGGFAESAPARVCVSQEAREPVLSSGGGCTLPEAPAAPAEATAPVVDDAKATRSAALTATALAPTFTPVPPGVTPPPTFTPAPPYLHAGSSDLYARAADRHPAPANRCAGGRLPPRRSSISSPSPPPRSTTGRAVRRKAAS